LAGDVEKAKPFHDVFALAIRRFRLAARHPVVVVQDEFSHEAIVPWGKRFLVFGST
jgi:hypothetical protein